MSEKENGSVVPDKITFRVDHETRRAIEDVMRTSGLKASAAIRTLVALGAARESQIEMTFKATAWREAVLGVNGIIQKGMQELVNRTFNLGADQK